MFRFKYILFIFLFFKFTSCKNENISNEVNSKKKIIYPKELAKNIELFPKLESQIVFDSIVVSDTTSQKNKISLNTVKFLIKKLSSDELTEENGYYFSAYEKIEDSKLDNKYEEFVKDIDIGMIQDANAFGIGRYEIGDSISLIYWNLSYESFPACPFFVGKHYFISLLYFDKIVSTKQIAGHETSADAPVSAETYVLGKIDKSLKLKRLKYFNVKEDNEVIESGKTIEVFELNKKMDWKKVHGK